MIAWEWVRRYPPLDPAAVAGRGAVRHWLARRVADDPDPARLRAAACGEWLLLLGEAEALPWVAGALYLGWDHGILLPTTHRPAIPVELLARALRRRHGASPGSASPGAGLIALLPDAVLVSAMPSHPVDVVKLGALP
jgi:hypothetical protein